MEAVEVLRFLAMYLVIVTFIKLGAMYLADQKIGQALAFFA